MNWIRNRWPNEATDFTPWLAENLELVSDGTGLDLSLLGQEVSAAGGRADIVAWETKSKNKAVIENQIDAADTRHFQQLTSYGEGLEARIRIWVAASFSTKFRRLVSEQNKKEESKPHGAVYFLLKIGRRKDENESAFLSSELGPTKSQIDKVLFSEDERASREKLIREFWEQVKGRYRPRLEVGSSVSAYIWKTVDMNEATISVGVMRPRGYRAEESLRVLNSYAKRLSSKFPETNTNPKWQWDEKRRTLLKLKMQIDLENVDSWEGIKNWFSETEQKLRSTEYQRPLLRNYRSIDTIYADDTHKEPQQKKVAEHNPKQSPSPENMRLNEPFSIAQAVALLFGFFAFLYIFAQLVVFIFG